MLDINVKTIDGQNRSYSVPDNYTVKQFKEKIANSLNIPVDRQRLIFQGRELKDTSSLSESDVNGKTLHLVQRIPPQPQSSSSSNTSTSTTRTRSATESDNGSGRFGAQMPFFNFNIQSNNNQANTNNPDVNQMINQLIGGLGEFGQNATFNTTNLNDSNGMEVHIDLGNVSQIVNENEIRARIRNIRRFLTMADSRLNRLNEIQSGAPLDDTPSSTIIVGSIRTTASLTDGTNIIDIDSTIPRPIAIANITHHPQLINQIAASALSNNTQAPTDASQTSLSDLNAHLAAHAAAIQNIGDPIAQEQIQAQSAGLAHHLAAVQAAHAAAQASTQTPIIQPQQTVSDQAGQGSTHAPSSTQSTPSAPTQASSSSTATQSNNPSATTGAPNSTNPPQQNIGVEVLADVTQSVMDSYSRFLPYLQQYHDMLINDINEPPESPNPNRSSTSSSTETQNTNNLPSNVVVLGDNRRQRFCNNINDMMHLLGHLFHNLSDLHINIRDRPPRQMHTMSSMTHSASAIIGAAVPVEATIQIPFPVQLSGNNSNPSGTTTQSPSTTPTTNTNQNPDPTQTPRAAGQPLPFTEFIRQASRANRSRSSQSFSVDSIPLLNSNRPPGPNILPSPPRPFIPLGAHSAHSTSNSYDQFLPCNSVHFYNSFNPVSAQQQQETNQQAGNIRPTISHSSISVRRRHPAGDQQSPSTNTSSTTTSSSTGPSAPNQTNDVSRLLTNILSSTLRAATDSNANPHIRVNIGGVPGTTNLSSTGFVPSSTIGNNQSPFSAPNMMPNQLSNLLSSLLMGATDTTSTSAPRPGLIDQLIGSFTGENIPPSSASTQSQNDPNLARMNATRAIIREAVNLMGSNNENDQRLDQPLREFMRLFGVDDEDESENNSSNNENRALNIFNVFFSSLTLGDMINLARGQNRNRVFERTRQPLRNYIQDILSNSNPETPREEKLNSLVDRIYLDIFTERNGLSIDFTQFEMIDPKVDLERSFQKLVKHHLRLILDHILDDKYENQTQTSESETWSAVLYKKFQTLIDQIIALNRACSKNADREFLKLCTQKIREAVVSSSPGGPFGGTAEIFSLFENFLQSQIQQVLDGVTVNRSLIEEFIVKKEDKKENTNNNASIVNTIEESAGASSAEQKSLNTSVTMYEDDNKSTDSNQYDSASSTLSGHSMDFDQHFNKIKESMKEEKKSEANASKSASSWISSVPSDWIPVIEKDIELQKNLCKNENGHSDAYCSGMPAKKRKILSSKNDLLSRNLFKKVLSRTLEQIQLKPNLAEEQLIEASLNQSQLIESFDAEFDMAITERLRQDPDFVTITTGEAANTEEKSSASSSSSSNDSNKGVFYNKDRYSISRKRFK